MTFVQTLNSTLRRVPNWLLYVVAFLAPAWFLYQGLTGGLGVDPVKALEWKIGKLGLQVLIVTLAITPLRNLFKLNLLKFRRALGLIGFFYIFLHLLVWLVLDVQILSQVWADILKRPYITIGMGAFVLMIPLAITSNNLSLRKLGPVRWRRLHKLTYAVLLLGGTHYLMVGKVWLPEAMLYMTVIVLLLANRVKSVPALKARLVGIFSGRQGGTKQETNGSSGQT